MKIIAEDNERITFLSHFEGQPCRFHKDKATGEVYVNADDMAKILGYKDQHEMLSTDAALDIIAGQMKRNGNSGLKEI